jgi:cell division protein FtsI/penicillin-binding protein 2
VVRSEELRYFAERQQMKVEKIMPDRGVIYDRDGVLLVYNRNDVSFYLDLRMVSKEDKKKIAEKFSSVFGKSYDHYMKIMSQAPKTICLEKKAPAEKTFLLKDFKITGLFNREDPTRVYHYNSLASHLVGYLNEEYSGVNGVEKSFNNHLKGEEGIRLVERNAIGDVITFSEEETRPALTGDNLYLTIKRSFQNILEEELKNGIKEYNAISAVGIIMNPNNGEILALANMDDYNPNMFWKFSDQDRRNKSVTDIYEPGSTFKTFSLAALFDQELCDESELVNVENGSYRFRTANIHDTHKHDWLTVKGVFEESSNIGFSKLSQRIDDDVFFKYLRGFGFGSYSTLNLPGEVKGTLKKPTSWSKLTKAFISFGYEISVTPVQLAAAFSAVVNGGILYKPQVIKNVTDSKGELITAIEKKEIRRVISEETSGRMKNLLKGVVEKGTGKLAKLDYVSIGGKTGTSKKIVNGKYTSNYFSSFVGFFPVENPQIVCLILVNDPQEGKYGGRVAAPVFKNVAERLIEMQPSLIGSPERIQPEEEDYDFVYTKKSEVEKNNIVPVIHQNKTVPIKSIEIKKNIMPDLKYVSLRDAITILTNIGLKYKINGSGRVISQSILPGQKIINGNSCVLDCEEIAISGTVVY